MTVRELKAALGELDDDAEVVVEMSAVKDPMYSTLVALRVGAFRARSAHEPDEGEFAAARRTPSSETERPWRGAVLVTLDADST